MKRERQLKRRLQALHTLGDAVGAMKTLAVHHYRAARAALPAGRAYRESLERMVADIGLSLETAPERSRSTAVLVVGADLSLDGDSSVRLVEAALTLQAAIGAGPLYCVGSRAAARLVRAGVPPQRQYPAMLSVEAAPVLLLRLGQDLLEDYAAERFGGLRVVSARFLGVGRFEPTVSGLIPPTVPLPNAEARPPRPSSYVGLEQLEVVALRELLYTVLYELLLDALAAEHGVRLLAAQAAERWIDDRMAAVVLELASTRRESATQEVLEIVAGARSVRQRTAPTSGNAWT